MKIPFRRKTPQRDLYLSMKERLHSELHDSDSELRQLFARVARSESRDFFGLHIGTELERFDQELATRTARALAALGSLAPSLDQHASEAIALTAEQQGVANAAIAKALDLRYGPFEPKPLCLTGVCPQRFATCSECTIPNKENL